MNAADALPSRAERFASAAEALVGVPFRLHGRDPQSGLDCVGVLAIAAAATCKGGRWPNGYALRMANMPMLDDLARQFGFTMAAGKVRRGDVLALRPGPGQVHFAVACGSERFVHAHAGLRRVVLGPLSESWVSLGLWRATPELGQA